MKFFEVTYYEKFDDEQLESLLRAAQREVEKALLSLENAYQKGKRIKEAENDYRVIRRARDAVITEIETRAVFLMAERGGL